MYNGAHNRHWAAAKTFEEGRLLLLLLPLGARDQRALRLLLRLGREEAAPRGTGGPQGEHTPAGALVVGRHRVPAQMWRG